MISSKLKSDVLFVNVDGMLDYLKSEGKGGWENRLDIVKSVKGNLNDNGIRALLLNPTKDADIQISPFPIARPPMVKQPMDMSIFVIRELYPLIKEYSFSHICIFQYDGYPINLDKWDDGFLEWDCLGHYSYQHFIENDNPAHYSLKNKRKGWCINGGFTLRSRELLERSHTAPLSDFVDLYNWVGCTNDDIFIMDWIDWNRMPLHTNVFNRFSADKPSPDSFGFHDTKR